MEDDLRERALESLDRQRRFSVLLTGYVVVSLALVVIWALTGDGYFWPGWPMTLGVLAFATAGLARSWLDRRPSEVEVRQRMAHLSGRPPSGVQR
jgi:fatty acid desaturase